MAQSDKVLAIVHKFFPDVRVVRDATKDATVEVTKEDTKAPGVKNHKACAMAIACKRSMKLDGIIVSRRIAYLIKENVATRYIVPEAVTREVVAFDRGGAFAPGEYELLQPWKSNRLGEPRTGKPSNTRTGTHKSRHQTANIRTRL